MAGRSARANDPIGVGGGTTVPGATICINTQTPLVQFLPNEDGTSRAPPGIVDLKDLTEGLDYRISPGGVTRMLLPLVGALVKEGVVKEAHWVALHPDSPATVRLPGLTLHNVHLEGDRLASYRKVKEAMWGAIHGLDGGPELGDLFWTEEFSEYAFYNRSTAEKIRELDRELDFDAFYIHDFQQLPVGQMLETLKPKIFRWHIPFDASVIPEHWKTPIAGYFNSYDVVVVSTLRYVAAVKAIGYAGKIRRVYPCVDPAEFVRPPAAEVRKVTLGYGIEPDHVLALIVARMDPMKGQDAALRALAGLAETRPKVRLVLAGNGSFSGSAGTAATSKGGRWRAHLEELAASLGVADRVVFTGHVTQHELDCLYERAAFTVLPSITEGFGLVVVESWIHGTPTLVTDRAGIAELIESGKNGLLFDPQVPGDLTRKMRSLVDDPELRSNLARAGARTARKCFVAAALKNESRLVGELAGE
jgi:glycosyltransferase involved in cell wall biosynthesis